MKPTETVELVKCKITIKEWCEEDRPREKLLAQGRRSLSDAELIAILIGSGNREETAVELSKRILRYFGNDLVSLGNVSVTELARFKGVGEAKASAIIAALELSRRRQAIAKRESKEIRSSLDIFDLLYRYFADLNHEEFWISLLNNAHKVIANYLISKGGRAGTIADPKIIFQIALEHHSSAIILAHNHPSGYLEPSEADNELTRKIQSAGSLLDISVLDHLIFANDLYFSYSDHGLIQQGLPKI